MNVEPAHRMFQESSHRGPVAVSPHGDLERVRFMALVAANAKLVRAEAFPRALLVCEDSGLFTVGLMALLFAGVEAVLAPNTQPGTIAALSGAYDRVVSDRPLEGIESWCLSENGEADDLAAIDPAAALLTLFTSGSTGRPNRVDKNLQMYEREAEALDRLWGERLAGATVYGMVPHYHQYGMTFKIMWPLMSGRPFQAVNHIVWDTILADWTPGAKIVSSPAHLQRTAGLPALPAGQRASMVLSAGAPLSQSAADSIGGLFGVAPSEIFGSTETGALAWRERGGGQAPPWQPLPGVKVWAEKGRLCLDSSFAGQHTGTEDRIEMGHEGGFSFHGRGDRITKIEGNRINLEGLERRLSQMSEIHDAALVVLDQPRPCLGAVLVLTADGREALARHGKFRFERVLRKQLARHEESIVLPRRWRFVEAVPVDAMGKRSTATLAGIFQEASPRPQEPAIEVIERSAKRTILSLDLKPDLHWFQGHFPGSPVLPGIVQVFWAVKMAARYMNVEAVPEDHLRVKFRQVLVPPIGVRLALNVDQAKQQLRFTFESEKGLHSQGRLGLRSG